MCCFTYTGFKITIQNRDKSEKEIANPLASIWTAAQMLDFFGYEEWGSRIVDSIEKLLENKDALTPDLGGTASTSECGDALIGVLQQQLNNE